jgi:hypothetical protein
MVAGAALVTLGFIGFAFHRNRNAKPDQKPAANEGQGEMNEPGAERSQWFWFSAALLAMTIITYIATGLPR